MATPEPVLAQAPKKVRPPTTAAARARPEDQTSHGAAEQQVEF